MTSNAIVPYADQEKMAMAIAKSGLFGLKDQVQVLALMAVAQAEGRHPATVAKDYHIIQGRPALKADAMLARFQMAGGSVQWKTYTDDVVTGIFSHPQGGSLEVSWTLAQAKAIGLATKDNWRLYPRAMLRARVISEGIRSVYPAVLVGEYTPEEVGDFKEIRDVTPRAPQMEIVEELEEVATDWNLYVPAANDTVELYKGCRDADEWMLAYSDLVAKVQDAKKLSDQDKSFKLTRLEEANYEILERFRNEQATA